MKKFLQGALLGAMIISLAGCQCHMEDCPRTGISIRLSHFDSADLSRIIVRRYDTVGFFTTVTDSFITSGTLNYDSQYVTDTSFTDTVKSGNLELVFPYAGKTVRIYEQQYDDQRMKRCTGTFGDPVQCINLMKSYVQDGIYHPLDSSSYFILVTK